MKLDTSKILSVLMIAILILFFFNQMDSNGKKDKEINELMKSVRELKEKDYNKKIDTIIENIKIMDNKIIDNNKAIDKYDKKIDKLFKKANNITFKSVKELRDEFGKKDIPVGVALDNLDDCNEKVLTLGELSLSQRSQIKLFEKNEVNFNLTIEAYQKITETCETDRENKINIIANIQTRLDDKIRAVNFWKPIAIGGVATTVIVAIVSILSKSN